LLFVGSVNRVIIFILAFHAGETLAFSVFGTTMIRVSRDIGTGSELWLSSC
jgi:hypothetical protein